MTVSTPLNQSMPDNGLRKAAVLLMHLGPERSAAVLSAMPDSEVEELMAEIVQLETVEAETVEAVVAEFREQFANQRFNARGGMGFARELLESQMGSERAQELLNRLNASTVELPFQFLRRADPRQILSFIQEEHPQTIALVLSYMGPDQAAIVLGELPPDLQADVAHRVAVMQRTSPDVIRQVEAMLERKLSTVLQPAEMTAVGGVQPLVDIINRADRTTERLILEALDARDPELAEQLRAQMFVFEDIVTLEDKSVQLLLRQVEAADLATALKGVRPDVREKVLNNMSERAATTLVEEIELLGPVRLKVVEESQAKIVHAIRQLEETGQITISRGGEDEFVA